MFKEFWEKNKKPIAAAALEMLRLMVLAMLPELIELIAGISIDPTIKVGIIAGLRYIDKYLHTLGKETDNESLTKGLLRF